MVSTISWQKIITYFFISIFTLSLSQAWAMDDGQTEPNLDAFKKRFIFVRKDGVLVQVRDNLLANSPLRLRPLLNYLKAQIRGEQTSMLLSLESYDKSIHHLFVDPVSQLNATPDYLMESLNQLQKIDVEYVFNHPEFLKVVAKLEDKINAEMAKLGLVTLAQTQDSKYFYTRNVSYMIVKSILEFAAQRLGEIPVLNTAVYVIKEAERLFRERRTFHQNMLMHYLEKFSLEELQLTKEERQLIWSSIYESRISWMAFWESDAAVSNWQGFGATRFSQNMSLATQRFTQNRRNYDSVGPRTNYAFQEATIKGQPVILNLFDTKNMFSSKESIAHYFDAPAKVKRQRQVLQLGQLGLSFISMPQFIKDLANSYMKSHYEAQRLTEGSLVAYFESINDSVMSKHMVKQNVNPFQQ